MRINGKLEKISDNKIVIVADDKINTHELTKLANGRMPSVELEIEDGRHITPDQRKKIFALIRDISEWSGEVPDMVETIMKSYVREIFAIDPYSLSNCSMTTANHMIYTILEFCFRNDVPFKTRTWDMIPNDYARQWFCLRFRKCVICGKPADLAHYEAVGMGRNRNKIDETKFRYMSLCRIHHVEQHTIGIETFIQKYHIKPIKLTADELKSIQPRYKTN
jgi:hypothetical protein